MARADQLLKLHETMVSTACASETRRQNVSVASTGLISAGIAVFASSKNFDFIYLSLPFLVISAIWFVTVRFYQQLARWKWKVVQEIEEELCFQPFTREWALFRECRGILAFGPSTLEQFIPALVFLATLGYVVVYVIRIQC